MTENFNARKRIRKSFQRIENIAEILLKDFNIEYVTISISKPGAIRDSQDVGIEITRKKNSST